MSVYFKKYIIQNLLCDPSSWLFLYKMKFLLAKNIMCVFKLLAKEETCPHWLHLWASLCCVFASCEMSPWPAAGLNNLSSRVLNRCQGSLLTRIKWRCSTRNPHKNHPDFYKRAARQKLEELLRVLKYLKFDQFSF